MQQKVALAMFAILLISNIGASAPANENVLHPNIVRAMDNADANTQIEFIVQYRPELTNEHLQTAEGIGIEVISIFEFSLISYSNKAGYLPLTLQCLSNLKNFSLFSVRSYVLGI